MRHWLAMQLTTANGCGTYLSVRLLCMQVFGDFSKDAGTCPRLLFLAIRKCWSGPVQAYLLGMSTLHLMREEQSDVLQWIRAKECLWNRITCSKFGHEKTNWNTSVSTWELLCLGWPGLLKCCIWMTLENIAVSSSKRMPMELQLSCYCSGVVTASCKKIEKKINFSISLRIAISSADVVVLHKVDPHDPPT